MSEPLIGEKEAAELLDLKPQTLAVWRIKGIGPAFYKMGRLVKYKRSELAAYVESTRCHNTGEAESLARA
jgi:hypothetical protein